jgi:dTDP-4-dehydrorhamnose reductase
LCGTRHPLTSFSSDLVFDGTSDRPYVEGDPVAPLNVYGRSKAEADAALLGLDGSMLVVRTASFFSPYDEHNFAKQLIGALREGRTIRAAGDIITSPTFVPDLVRTTLDLMIDGETGLWHLVSGGHSVGLPSARRWHVRVALMKAWSKRCPPARWAWTARRPAQAALASTRCGVMPSLGDAIRRFSGGI